MGSRIQKIAFIVFTLLFVAIMAVMNTSILNLGTNANKQLSTTLQTSDSASLEVYNDAIVSGSTVQSAAKNPASVSSVQLTIGIVTADNPDGKKYDANNTYKGQTDLGKINTSAQFSSYLVKNKNDVVTGVLFVQSNATVTGSAKLSGILSEGDAPWSTMNLIGPNEK